MFLKIGTIGFAYTDWREVFYPKGTPASNFLPAYASAFDALELDTTFHAIPPIDRVQKWTDAVPHNFTFCVKTPRQITHDAPIAFGTRPMKDFLTALRPMQRAAKLGPILIQFPPTFPAAEFKNVETFLKDLPTDFRYAVEFRNPTWENQRAFDLLKHYRCAWVAADYGNDPFPIHPTTDFLFLRFIGIHKQFSPYTHERIDTTERLHWWHEQILAISPPPTTTYAFFTDDYAGHAPATVNRFRMIAGLSAPTPSIPKNQNSLFSPPINK
jgi:uncharacterized protein YecE (DUF72 family)